MKDILGLAKLIGYKIKRIVLITMAIIFLFLGFIFTFAVTIAATTTSMILVSPYLSSMYLVYTIGVITFIVTMGITWRIPMILTSRFSDLKYP